MSLSTIHLCFLHLFFFLLLPPFPPLPSPKHSCKLYTYNPYTQTQHITGVYLRCTVWQLTRAEVLAVAP